MQNECKKKKKRRKRNKKKKKAGDDPQSAQPSAQQENSDSVDDDPEFEEDLKQFQLRLMTFEASCQSLPSRKLKPNVTNDWLLTIREKSKSLSESFPQQLTLVS